MTDGKFSRYENPTEKGQGLLELLIGSALVVLTVYGIAWALSELFQKFEPILGEVDTEKALVVIISALISVFFRPLSRFFLILASKFVSYIQQSVRVQLVEIPQRLVQMKDELEEYIHRPRWYKGANAIEPGMIEVSLAVTAVLVALPTSAIPMIKALKLISETISIVISIGMLNSYAHSKGSTTHILINPFENGPIFFLGWSVLFALLFIALAF